MDIGIGITIVSLVTELTFIVSNSNACIVERPYSLSCSHGETTLLQEEDFLRSKNIPGYPTY